ncbi:MAG: enoyl-CoA hydratase/isomerase family protein [Ignavibacteriales bacterium]|nr:enoyl-CoA hydratase/isomerase family protein [Ignavibacteriales bacterium]
MLALKDAPLEENSRDVELLSRFFKSVSSCSKPVIAAVNGPALAGGCGLALAADYIIADTRTALFGFPEVKRGFIPALVSDILVKRAGEGIARRLLIGGETISAPEACRIGLIDATSENPLDDALMLAAEWAKNPLITMQTIKKMLLKLPSLDSDEKEFYLKQQNLHGRYTPEFEKGIQSFLKKR